ncbi:hypothetical protein KOI35_21045 [Actinoplanes bogorensis]|uniref:Uncharacterized protein n=1 Tax=Paractinoplanes bogorensis TaxID=1610840 RepID=A0ABS5YTF4_9ACTN|nr:hypothetical protein [Actinoplanes bogorensis]MBU2666003.1 hypothetical protein [Actinoplanes bogorensis]
MPDDYLRQIELLAKDVVGAAGDEGWLSHQVDPSEATPLQRAVNELARKLRHHHFPGDGCDSDHPQVLHLGGAAIIQPGETDGQRANYTRGCAVLGVRERSDGWALWYTWDDRAKAHTMVTTALETTRGLLDNWSAGNDVHPAQPERAQIAAVVRNWVGPMTLSPSHATHVGLGGR